MGLHPACVGQALTSGRNGYIGMTEILLIIFGALAVVGVTNYVLDSLALGRPATPAQRARVHVRLPWAALMLLVVFMLVGRGPAEALLVGLAGGLAVAVLDWTVRRRYA
jgi:hypothetical protein